VAFHPARALLQQPHRTWGLAPSAGSPRKRSPPGSARACAGSIHTWTFWGVADSAGGVCACHSRVSRPTRRAEGKPIDSRGRWQQIAAVRVDDQLTQAVRQAIEEAPASLRALARAAGVPDSTLVRIRKGERRATPAVATAVAASLERWSTRCGELARQIQDLEPRSHP
jgi:hypothetical protein